MLSEFVNRDELLTHPGITVYLDRQQLEKQIRAAKSSFKIGAAHDALQRWIGYYDNNGKWVPALKRDFRFLAVVVVEDNFAASSLEEELITAWKTNKFCMNNTSGGEGVSHQVRSVPYFVYVAFQ